MNALFADNPLNVLFAIALLIGFIYALFLILSQGIGNAFDIGDIELFGHDIDLSALADIADQDIDLDLDADLDGSEATGLSMLAISGFTTAFGAFGLAASTLAHASGLVSLIAALVGGVVVGTGAQYFFVRIISVTTSSNLNLSTIKGQAAQVIVPVPDEGRGQIAFILSGQRVTLGARSSTGLSIPRGTHVVVDSIRDGIAFISPDHWPDSPPDRA
jgi:hypothetical protein